MLSVIIKCNGEKYTYPKGVSLYDVSKDFQKNFSEKIIISIVNGTITELNQEIFNNSEVEFYDVNSYFGNKVYEAGLLFILIKAFRDVFGSRLIIKHSIDRGLYIKSDIKISESKLEKVKDRMNELISNDLPIEKLLINRKEAIRYYEKLKDYDKVNILKYNTNTNINLYKLDNTYDYFFNELPISTGYIKEFKINMIDDNSFVLSFPSIYSSKVAYKHHDKLFKAFEEQSNFCETLGISSICDLNSVVSNGKINEFIFLAENEQNNRLAEIARKIYSNKDIKMVLISGPSSSGKTTTSKKLQLYLKQYGLVPKTMSIDDYFVDREKTPKKADGSYDFESIEAVNVKLFNSDLKKLLNGEKVKMPTFNFALGKGEYRTEATSLGKNDILIIEGLHALNNVLTESIDKKYKFKMYLSPLTVLNIDNHNRMKTSDIRLLRRIVRDNRTRGYNAREVISAWSSVRAGEETNVFPYQDEADVIFNTALFYEVGVLKVYVEPLLYIIEENEECYKFAIRLLNLLKNILPIPSDYIPKDSILREFVGNGYFE
ncbi:MAG: nucleoside kinase [Bacilli bacterium]|nr:nucleoside kinase [Bacilli bacterium]